MKKAVLFILSVFVALTLASCGGDANNDNAAAVSLDVNAVYGKFSEAVALPEMLELDADLMLDYCGIRAEDIKEAVVVICADSLRTDEIWVIDAKDTAAADTIVQLAEKRLEKKGEESITYSPEQYAVVEKAELLRQGNYVTLIVSPDAADLADVFRQEAGL